MSLAESGAWHSNEQLVWEFGRRKAPAPRLGPHHSGPPARPTRPRAGPAARRALAGSARVSVEGAGTGEHHPQRLVANHSFGDGPPVQSQTSASPLIADIFAPPWGPPGGEDCHSRRRRGSSACSVSRTGWALQKWVARIRPWHCTSEPVAGSRSATRTRQPDAHRDVTQDNTQKKKKKGFQTTNMVVLAANVAPPLSLLYATT